MYELVKVYNKNGVHAFVQAKNVKDWLAKGWSTEQPGGPDVEAYKVRSDEATTPKKK